MFFDDNSQKLNLKKINAVKELHRHSHAGVICTACQKPLSDEESMIAGMGPVCLERTRFAESVTREELFELEGLREPINKGLYPARTVILREKNDPLPKYVSILSVDPLEALVIDRTEMNEVYKKTGSMAEAIAQALRTFVPIEGESVAPAQTPKHPEVMRKFKIFQKEIRGLYKERSEYLKDHPFNAYYNQVFSKKSLTEDQEKKREELLKQKVENPEFFQKGWSQGKFHRATWIARMQHTQLSEAKLLGSVLESKNLLEGVDVKDYGLTDPEILQGLQHSQQVFEKHLFKSFIEGNKNLILLIEFYKQYQNIDPKDRLLNLRLAGKIANKETLNQLEKDQISGFMSTLKIPSRLLNL